MPKGRGYATSKAARKDKSKLKDVDAPSPKRMPKKATPAERKKLLPIISGGKRSKKPNKPASNFKRGNLMTAKTKAAKKKK